MQQGVTAGGQKGKSGDHADDPWLVEYTCVPCNRIQSPCACLQDLVEALSAKDTWFIPRKYDQATWERTPEGQYAGYEEIVPFGGAPLSLHVYVQVRLCLHAELPVPSTGGGRMIHQSD